VALSDWLTLIGVVVAVAAFFFTQRNFAETVQRDINKSSEALNSRVAVLETKIDLFWAGLMKDAATILHHPDPVYAERDGLLEKLLAGEITLNELTRLREMLKPVVGTLHTDSENTGEALAASILLRLIETQSLDTQDTSS
jgi:hypothetical protein